MMGSTKHFTNKQHDKQTYIQTFRQYNIQHWSNIQKTCKNGTLFMRILCPIREKKEVYCNLTVLNVWKSR